LYREDEEDDMNQIQENVGQKRKAQQELVDTRKLKRQNKMKYLTYYQGSFYSKSTAMNLYELSK